MQRERPFEGRFEAISDCLMVLHRGGPVDVTFRMGGKTVDQHIPKGGIFFLPAGHDCEVSLHSALDTIHIYLRAESVRRAGQRTIRPRNVAGADLRGSRSGAGTSGPSYRQRHRGEYPGLLAVRGSDRQGHRQSLYCSQLPRSACGSGAAPEPADRQAAPQCPRFCGVETGDRYQAERDGGYLRPV